MCVWDVLRGLCGMQVKHLNTLGVEQVAAAIHTQGLGLADNAVNAAYQFLARNFTLLSQVNSQYASASFTMSSSTVLFATS